MSNQTATRESGGVRFVPQDSRFCDRVTVDGSSGFPAEAGRYHLYVSLACPWAHRAIILRHLKGSRARDRDDGRRPIRDDRGWHFNGEFPDELNGCSYLSEGYAATDPEFEGRVSVPLLWDTVTGRIVNNESADVIDQLDGSSQAFARHPDRVYAPLELRDEMAELNERVYETLNNGVHRAGFATGCSPRSCASTPSTTATLRCNQRRIADSPNLHPYLRDLYQVPGVAQTVDFDHIKRHYYGTQKGINPTGIVPAGPLLDLGAPHGRG